MRSAAEEAERLTALAETLLVFSRAEGGRVPLHRWQARLDELLQAACPALAARASAAGVDVRVVPYGVTAFADAVLVRQAVENVVGNAPGHTPRGGQVRVSATRDGDTVRLTVKDTGTGFDPAFLPSAIDPFARGPAEKAGPGQGAGLGLAIVRATAEAHGGRAAAANRAEGGARVTLFLHPTR